MKNDVQFAARVPRELRDRWTNACEAAGQDAASIARELFQAAIRYYERNGNLYAPFELVPAARTPDEKLTYTISAGGIAVGVNNGAVHVAQPQKRERRRYTQEQLQQRKPYEGASKR